MTEKTNDSKGNALIPGCFIMAAFWAAILMAILLTSCSTSRKTEQTTINTETTHSEITSTAETHSQLDAFRRWEQSQWRDLDIHVLYYDTSQPTDSITARPPLLAEVTLNSSDRSETKNEATEHIDTSSDIAISETTDSDRTQYTERKSETKAGSEVPTLAEILFWVASSTSLVWLASRTKPPTT